jgi:hypothetical protein
MNTIVKKLGPSLKAWVAAILPIITTIVADWSGGIEIDARVAVGTIVVSTFSWIVVYFTPNTPDVEVDA